MQLHYHAIPVIFTGQKLHIRTFPHGNLEFANLQKKRISFVCGIVTTGAHSCMMCEPACFLSCSSHLCRVLSAMLFSSHHRFCVIPPRLYVSSSATLSAVEYARHFWLDAVSMIMPPFENIIPDLGAEGYVGFDAYDFCLNFWGQFIAVLYHNPDS
jgi:hypothetical protein